MAAQIKIEISGNFLRLTFLDLSEKRSYPRKELSLRINYVGNPDQPQSLKTKVLSIESVVNNYPLINFSEINLTNGFIDASSTGYNANIDAFYTNLETAIFA